MLLELSRSSKSGEEKIDEIDAFSFLHGPFFLDIDHRRLASLISNLLTCIDVAGVLTHTKLGSLRRVVGMARTNRI